MEKELTTLLGQVETAKVNTVEEFKASQTFIDSYAIYYDSEFEDCLKQVKSIYPTLDLSKITMDKPLPSTLTGDTTLRKVMTLLSQSLPLRMMASSLHSLLSTLLFLLSSHPLSLQMWRTLLLKIKMPRPIRTLLPLSIFFFKQLYCILDLTFKQC